MIHCKFCSVTEVPINEELGFQVIWILCFTIIDIIVYFGEKSFLLFIQNSKYFKA